MINKIEERIRELEFGLPESIRQIQLSYLPSIIDMEIIEKEEYRYDGKVYPIQDNERIFLVYNLPIKSASNIISSFKMSMLEAVYNRIIHPFVLFINDKPILWSKITIVSNTKYYYMIIDNLVEDINDIKTLNIPYRIRYGEDNIVNVNYKGNLYFNALGRLTNVISEIVMRIEIISSYVNCSSLDYSKGYIEIPTDRYNKPATEDNVILFNNGKLVDRDDILIEKGCNIFEYNGEENTNGLVFKTFYYNMGNISNDNIYKLDNAIIKDNIVNGVSNDYMDRLKEKLDLDITMNDTSYILDNIKTDDIKAVIMDDDTVVIAYKDIGNINKGTIMVVDDNSNGIISGTKYVFNKGETSSINLIKVDTNRILIFYTDMTSGIIGKVTNIIISGTNLIIGNTIDFSTSMIFNLNVAKINDSDYVVCYSDLLNSDYGNAQYISFNNDYSSANISPKYVFVAEAISNIDTVPIGDGSVCVCYTDSLGYGSIVIITIDMVGINISNKHIFTSEPISQITCIPMSRNKVCISYLNAQQNIVLQSLNIYGNAINILPKYITNQNVITSLSATKVDDNNILLGYINVDNSLSYEVVSIIDNIVSDRDMISMDGDVSSVDILYMDNITYIVFIDDKGEVGIYSTHNYYNKLNMKIEKIMLYNPELLETIYDELTPFESSTYSGIEINQKRDTDGFLIMPRRRYNNIFCNVIVFVNGELYKHYGDITYINDKFKLPIKDISSTDSIEIVFIKNIDNSESVLTVFDKDTVIKAGSIFNPNSISFYSGEYNTNDMNHIGESSNRPYTPEDTSNIVYNIPFTIVDNGDGEYNVNLDSDFYYNKPLSVVSNSLFKYKKFVMEYDQVDIGLGGDFKYCIDKGRYLVFINGRAISQDNFVLAVPGYYNPFDQVLLYINIIMEPEDIVDVFYLPFKLNDVYNKSELSGLQSRNIFDFNDWSRNGTITVTRGEINKWEEDSFTMTSNDHDCFTNTYLKADGHFISVIPDTTYTLTYNKRFTTKDHIFIFYWNSKDDTVYASNVTASSITSGIQTITFTTPSYCNYVTIRFGVRYIENTETFSDIQIVEGEPTGDIRVDKTMLPFGLTKNNYWYFINGKKINANDIENISDHRLSIKTDYKSTLNFNIKQFMNPIEILSKLIDDNDTWDDIVSSLGSDINNFFQTISLTSTEDNTRGNEIDMRAAVLEAFRHYYAKYNISSNSLVYDFNDILIDNNYIDNDDNYIVDVFDANLYNSADVDR